MDTATATPDLLTTGQAADALGARLWQIQSVIERGLFTTDGRIGTYRTIRADRLNELRAALVKAGYLQPAAA